MARPVKNYYSTVSCSCGSSFPFKNSGPLVQGRGKAVLRTNTKTQQVINYTEI